MTLTIREPGSAITHFVAMIMALCALFPLMIRADEHSCTASMLVFGLSMVILYGASTTYHSVNVGEKILKVFKRIDHLSIFLLIAGTYTPICTVALKDSVGPILLVVIWSMALVGMATKFFWIYCPKWFSSIIYIAMGWVCVFAFKPLLAAVPVGCFGWLLAGGIVYTIGGIIYGIKTPRFDLKHPHFNKHCIFHLFIMGGTICHFICMYKYVVMM